MVPVGDRCGRTAAHGGAVLARQDGGGAWRYGRSAARVAPPFVPPAITTGLARIDTLLLAGLDSEAQAEVRVVLARPPTELESLLAWSEGLSLRGYGSAGVRLGGEAALVAPGGGRGVRAVFPWP